MTDKKIQENIKAREAEIQAVAAAFEKRKAEVQSGINEFQKEAAAAQLKVTHLEGCIAELKRMLPKPKPPKPPKK